MIKVITVFLLSIIYYLLSITLTFATVNISQQYAFGDLKNLGQGLDRLVLPAFGIAAIGVIFYFIIGAFKYISSGGDKEEVAKARGMITHGLIGFILLMSLFLVVNFLFARLFGVNIQFIKGLQ